MSTSFIAEEMETIFVLSLKNILIIFFYYEEPFRHWKGSSDVKE